ncbi:MAG: tetratricopeptide repeat protein, partial [Nannocystaceae bacterium]
RLDLHDQAGVLDLLGKRPPLSDIMGFGFWGKASRQAYTAAGSFCLWLLETYGVDGLIGVYANAGDFEAVYGMSLVDLEAQWVGFLKARSVDTRDIEAQRERFRRRPIFARPCAHRAANLIAEATRAQTRGEPTRGLALLSELCAIEPEKPKNHLRLAYAEASVGDYDGAQQTLKDLQSTADLSDSLLGLADERLGDLALAKGELVEARSAYESALGRHLSEARTRVLQIKHLATVETDARLAAAV